MEEYTPPDHFDGSPNFYYPTEYRILNCWECFEAQGKICSELGHNSLYHHTKSSDPGNAFCCKPDSTDGYCQHGATHDYADEEGITTVCSQPSTGANSKFANILTGNRNHQVFAFCPSINHQKCGVPSDTQGSTDMNLKAGLSKIHVQSSDMRYKKPNPQDSSREYDACYYEVTLDSSILEKYNPDQINVHISQKTNMNVFIYGGLNRMEATESVVLGNQQASVGQTYSISPSKGFLIVAYPNEQVTAGGSETEFGFNYWVDATLKPEDDDDSAAVPVIVNDSGSGKIVIQKDDNGADRTMTLSSEPEPSDSTIIPGQENDLMFYGLCAAAGILFLAIVILCIKCRRKGKITQQAGDSQVFGQNVTNERSLHLEDMDEEDYKNPNDTNRPSLGGKQDNLYGDGDKLPRRASYSQVKSGGSQLSHKEDGTEDPDEC